jgi:hypothetical protein
MLFFMYWALHVNLFVTRRAVPSMSSMGHHPARRQELKNQLLGRPVVHAEDPALSTPNSLSSSVTFEGINLHPDATTKATSSLKSTGQKVESSGAREKGQDADGVAHKNRMNDVDSHQGQQLASETLHRIAILPHIFDRFEDGRYEPQVPHPKAASLDDIDSKFFYVNHIHSGTSSSFGSGRPPHATHRTVNPMLPSQEFLGFIRITKTASTSIAELLAQTRNVASAFSFVRSDDFVKDKENWSPVPGCVFSYHATNRSSAPSSAEQFQINQSKCPHYTYLQIVSFFSRSVPYLRSSLMSSPSQPAVTVRDVGGTSTARSSRQLTVTTPPDEERAPIQAKLKMFTILRDPLDRQVSFFHYWRQIYPGWLTMVPESWVPLLVGGDLVAWLQVRSNTTITSTKNLAFCDQSYYFAPDVDRAIQLVTAQPVVATPRTQADGSPDAAAAAAAAAAETENSSDIASAARLPQTLRVVPLVSDCLDASVGLLVELFPDVFEPGSDKAFLKSRAKNSNPGTKPKPGMMPIGDDVNMTVLRRRALEWFADDYRFYDAAVGQFRDLLARFKHLDGGMVDRCLRKLDERHRQRAALLLG